MQFLLKMEKVLVVFIGLFGLAFSSFLATLSYRSSRGLSILSPPSFCPGCGRRLGLFELMPVLGYLMQRGKCRACGYKIPIQYLCAELVLPGMYMGMYLLHGFSLQFFIYIYLVGLLVYLSLVDIDRGFVSAGDVAAVYAGGAAVVFFILFGFLPDRFVLHLYGFIAVCALLLVSVLLVYVRKKVMSVGIGDLLIIPGTGLYFSFREDIRILVFTALAGVIVGLLLISAKKVKRDFKFPMIPFIAAGMCIEIFLF